MVRRPTISGELSADHLLDYLKREDSLLALVLNSLFDGVYVVDRQRRILFWNRGAEQLTGYSSAEVLGRRCSEDILNHVDDQGTRLCQVGCPLSATLTSGRETQQKVYPLHKEGHRFPVQTHVAPIRDASGEVVAGVEVFRDISKEEDHRVLQEKFSKLIRRYVSSSTFETVQDQAASDQQTTGRALDVSVLCLDVVGFTAFSEGREPQQVVAMLNEVFSACDAITRRFHGDIDKFVGDALVAVFPDANDAVDAAASIQVAMMQLNTRRRARGEQAITLRVGVNSGPVIQGEIGTSERKDLTVIGDVVNTASRIEAACDPGMICISESTYSRLTSDRARRFTFEGELLPKGKQQPVSIFKRVPGSDTQD